MGMLEGARWDTHQLGVVLDDRLACSCYEGVS